MNVNFECYMECSKCFFFYSKLSLKIDIISDNAHEWGLLNEIVETISLWRIALGISNVSKYLLGALSWFLCCSQCKDTFGGLSWCLLKPLRRKINFRIRIQFIYLHYWTQSNHYHSFLHSHYQIHHFHCRQLWFY